MKRILITGTVASGKSTLARKLSEKLTIQHYELDSIVHTQKYKRTEKEQIKIINEIDKSGEWIFEGTNRKSYRFLFDLADTVIFLDTPLWKRRLRIIIRFIKQKIGFEKSLYKPEFKMLRKMYEWTDDFEEKRDEFNDFLNRYEEKIIRLKDVNDIFYVKKF